MQYTTTDSKEKNVPDKLVRIAPTVADVALRLRLSSGTGLEVAVTCKQLSQSIGCSQDSAYRALVELSEAGAVSFAPGRKIKKVTILPDHRIWRLVDDVLVSQGKYKLATIVVPAVSK